MLEFIFSNSRRNETLTNNSRQTIGSKKNYAINRHASWQHNHNKNTLTSSPCGNCSTVSCGSWWEPNTNGINSCTWRCPTTTQGVYLYCNGIPPPDSIQKF